MKVTPLLFLNNWLNARDKCSTQTIAKKMKCLVIGVESLEKSGTKYKNFQIRLPNSHQLFHQQNNLDDLQLKNNSLNKWHNFI